MLITKRIKNYHNKLKINTGMGKKEKDIPVEEEVDEAEIEKNIKENGEQPQLTKEELEELDNEGSALAAVTKMIKKMSVGSDISNIALPGSFILPKSTLRYFTDNFSTHFDQLLKANKIDDDLERFLQVYRYLITTLRETPDTNKKPLNPVLGETWEAKLEIKNDDDNGSGDCYAFAEQVSHHPPISSSCVYSKKQNVRVNYCQPIRSQFMGTYVKLTFDGTNSIHLGNYDETITFNSPTMAIRFLRKFSEYVNKCEMTSNKHDYRIKVNYFAKPLIGGSYNSFETKVYKGKEKLYKIKGVWNGESKITNLKTNETTSFFVRPKESNVNMVFPEEVPSTNSNKVWKGVFDAHAKGDTKSMSSEKIKVEEEQRKIAAQRLKDNEEWKPIYFHQNENGKWELNNYKE